MFGTQCSTHGSSYSLVSAERFHDKPMIRLIKKPRVACRFVSLDLKGAQLPSSGRKTF